MTADATSAVAGLASYPTAVWRTRNLLTGVLGSGWVMASRDPQFSRWIADGCRWFGWWLHRGDCVASRKPSRCSVNRHRYRSYSGRVLFLGVVWTGWNGWRRRGAAGGSEVFLVIGKPAPEKKPDPFLGRGFKY